MARGLPVGPVLLGFAAAFALASPCLAADSISGSVKSSQEAVMEGVVVTARLDGASFSVSVVTDASGRYAFPSERLAAGRYSVTARAAGYDLEGRPTADVKAGQTASLDLQLQPAKDLAAQLTNAEWLTSLPGTDEQKKFLLNCNSCHSLERIVKSKYDAEGFLDIFQRMSGYYPGSTPERPQPLAGSARREGLARDGDSAKTAEWLASINLSRQATWSYPLKTLPRLSGKSTKVIITEYDLPNKAIQPHDVIMDRQGMVWYSDFGQMFLGRMNPADGRVTEYAIPETKKNFPVGTLDLETDHNDDLWIGVMYQGAIAKFNRASGTFRTWSIPKEWDSDAGQLGHLATNALHVDNKVWIKNSDGNNIYRLDLATDKIESLGSFKDPVTGRRIGSYGIHADSKNNLYLLDYSAGNIGRIDAKTKAFSIYMTPTPKSRPRRGRVDGQDRLWFAEYGSDGVGMLDPESGRITEWKIPTKWSAPYDAMLDRHGDAWTGSMLTDRVARINTATGEVIEYPLPRSTNIRRVFVDDRSKPGVLWIGNNHGASIVKVEPLL